MEIEEGESGRGYEDGPEEEGGIGGDQVISPTSGMIAGGLISMATTMEDVRRYQKPRQKELKPGELLIDRIQGTVPHSGEEEVSRMGMGEGGGGSTEKEGGIFSPGTGGPSGSDREGVFQAGSLLASQPPSIPVSEMTGGTGREGMMGSTRSGGMFSPPTRSATSPLSQMTQSPQGPGSTGLFRAGTLLAKNTEGAPAPSLTQGQGLQPPLPPPTLPDGHMVPLVPGSMMSGTGGAATSVSSSTLLQMDLKPEEALSAQLESRRVSPLVVFSPKHSSNTGSGTDERPSGTSRSSGVTSGGGGGKTLLSFLPGEVPKAVRQ